MPRLGMIATIALKTFNTAFPIRAQAALGFKVLEAAHLHKV